ncbi:hypothetical protein GCM10008910_45140 [Faecalicatena orotica]|uniref:CO-methylating acetyl-CoA synthase n=1 Tax=Faecalicatena orotica TaxID=1544 RepID=A0A2Y9BJU3_9FIRM|nr:hypothetical protein [Faecalicatena orotica]PWJ29542.1 hypothetical protein A8806_106281 [Faecalicatena orotica]SSA55997.1 hypothetical protein SAMN05216536_106281 [Faecalicatena orotica]
MELYDEIIRNTREYLSAYTPRCYPYDEKQCWEETASGEMVMLRDAAFELGGGNCESVNYTCVTSALDGAGKNEVLLYGPELSELKGDVSFARIVFLTADPSVWEGLGEEAAYRFIRDLEYVRYHVYPRGYMVRTSAKSSKEQARVSREALKAGISFEKLGAVYIRKYLQNPGIQSVQVLFLTGLYSLVPFQKEAGQAEAVTEALNHILKGMPMNCGTCDLKVICDEVEGMRALHQKKR